MPHEVASAGMMRGCARIGDSSPGRVPPSGFGSAWTAASPIAAPGERPASSFITLARCRARGRTRRVRLGSSRKRVRQPRVLDGRGSPTARVTSSGDDKHAVDTAGQLTPRQSRTADAKGQRRRHRLSHSAGTPPGATRSRSRTCNAIGRSPTRSCRAPRPSSTGVRVVRGAVWHSPLYVTGANLAGAEEVIPREPGRRLDPARQRDAHRRRPAQGRGREVRLVRRLRAERERHRRRAPSGTVVVR